MGNNRHVSHDTASRVYPLYSVPSTNTAFSPLIPQPNVNVDVSYDHGFHPTDDDRAKASQDHYCLNRTNGAKVSASSSGGNNSDDDDDEDGLFNRKSHNGECCRSESYFGGSDAGLDDDHDHTDEDNMVEVSVANEIEEGADMVGVWEE